MLPSFAVPYNPAGKRVAVHVEGSAPGALSMLVLRAFGPAVSADMGQAPGNPAGKEVWCSQGKGFPRRVAAPTGDAAVDRCECSDQPVYSDAARLYDGCSQTATRCRVAGAAAV